MFDTLLPWPGGVIYVRRGLDKTSPSLIIPTPILLAEPSNPMAITILDYWFYKMPWSYDSCNRNTHDDYYTIVDLIFQYMYMQHNTTAEAGIVQEGAVTGKVVTKVMFLCYHHIRVLLKYHAMLILKSSSNQSSQKGNMSGLDQPICRSRQKISIVQVRSGRQCKRWPDSFLALFYIDFYDFIKRANKESDRSLTQNASVFKMNLGFGCWENWIKVLTGERSGADSWK